MVASMSGGTYFAYKYFTSEQFKAKIMTEIMGNVQTLMPKVLDNTMPDMSYHQCRSLNDLWIFKKLVKYYIDKLITWWVYAKI